METEIEKKNISNLNESTNNILNNQITKSNNIKSYSDYNSNNNNKRQNNNESHFIQNNSTNANSNNQKTTTLNLSKIQYKDGFILKDASNSNPGFALWSIKNENNNNLNNLNNNNKKIEEKTIENYNEITNSTDKKLIDELKFKCNDLEKKLQNALYQYYEKENYVRNSEKLKEEYEQIVHKNIEEKNFLVEEKKNLEMNLTHYSNAFI